MNPFDLPGPQFLQFYFFLSLIVISLVVLLRRAGDSTVVIPRLQDPYQIAYLRGGKDEVLRVAAVSLLDRNLLKADSAGELTTADNIAIETVRRPLDQAILERFKLGGDATKLTSSRSLEAATSTYEKELAQLGLLPDAATYKRRYLIAGVAILFLLAIAVAKIAVALSRGRTNLLFLVFLSVIAVLVVRAVASPRRTRAGDAVLSDLRELFAGLKLRRTSLAPGGQGNELAFLAAIFGLEAVPAEIYPFATLLRRTERAQGDSFWSSGSSCGSSSCGSSCGGGGCGGGCGGCGS